MYEILYDKTQKKDIGIRRLTDGAIIPFDDNNYQYREYLKWLEDGNEPTRKE